MHIYYPALKSFYTIYIWRRNEEDYGVYYNNHPSQEEEEKNIIIIIINYNAFTFFFHLNFFSLFFRERKKHIMERIANLYRVFHLLLLFLCYLDIFQFSVSLLSLY